MNDQVRNKIVHQLVAHQSISETSSESWMESAVSGGVPFTISEHVYMKPGGYDFQEAAFFNYLFKEEIDDEFVKLFEIFQIFKQLPPILQNIPTKVLITKLILASTIVV
jgi:hypothetical protein